MPDNDLAYFIPGLAQPYHLGLLQGPRGSAGLFGQVLALCRRAGLVTLGHVAMDGNRVTAKCFEAPNHELRMDEGEGRRSERPGWRGCCGGRMRYLKRRPAGTEGTGVAMLEQAIGNLGTIPGDASADPGCYPAKKWTDLTPAASIRSSQRQGLDAAEAANEARPGAPTPR